MLHKNNSLTFFLIFSLLQCCTSSRIITADKPLRDDGNVLVSPAQNFALGFFSPGNGNSSNSRRYVGIWYNNVSPQTVVWVANRDSPVTNQDGVLTLDESTGNLVLFDSQKPDVVIWRSSNVSESSAVVGSNYSVELSDSGNLVVSQDGKSNGFVWQSFDFPTDTLLSNMKLGVDRRSGLNRFLTSWKSPDDPGTGSYSLMVDINGSLPPQLFLYRNRQPIWRGGPWNGRAWSGVPEMAADFIFNISYVDNAEEVYLVDYMRNTSIISRMIVNESTGTLQRITWKHNEHKWFTFYSAPKDQCDGFRYCGDFGYCGGIHIVGEPQCNCLPGFKPKSVQDWYLRDASQGCIQKRDGQMCGNGEGFVIVAGAKVPDTIKTRLDKNLGHEACADMCLKNCSCTGYSSADVRGGGFNGCITWYDKLVDFREYQSGGQDFYLRVDAVELANHRKKSKRSHTYIRVLVIVPMSAALLVLLTLGYWFIMKKRRGIAQRRQESMLWFTSKINGRRVSVHGSPKGEEVNEMGTSTVDVKLYPLSTITTATENFSIAHKLGEGGFGSVYKGKLHNGQDFAVKRLSNTSGQGIEEFRNEVTLIAKLQHINLVRLVGYCIQKEEKMLIYEYLPNKGLDCFLFDKEKKHMLDWKKRFDITVGIARGMAYLHHESRLKIIHRDLKASNILLDANLNPKISDFGMARMFRNDQIEEMTTRVVGTYGYMSPEYAMEGLFSTKSDVFSFGVLLLEIITGRKNSSYHVENFGNLIGHVWDLWEKSKVLDIVDQSLGELHEHNPNILRCIHVGLLCVQESATARPSMSEVVFMLCNETNLPSPQAAFILRTSNQGPSKTSSGSVGAISVNEVTISTVEGR